MTPWSLLLVAAGVRALVLPFEHVGGDPAVGWKGSAFEEAVASHFELAGVDVVDPAVRNRAYAELGFHPSEPVSRATAIVLGRELGASRLVVGSYRELEGRLEVEARLEDLERVATVGVVDDFAEGRDLRRLSSQVAKNLFRLQADHPPPGFEEHAARRARIVMPAIEATARARLSVEDEERRQLLERALSYDSAYLEARLALGRLLVRLGEPRRAIDVLVAAGEAAALSPKAYFDLGLAYLAVDEPASALQIFASLSEREIAAAASFNNRGVCLMKLERYEEASEAFARAHAKDEDDPVYLFNLGWSAWRAGKGARALEYLERASECAPWDAQACLLLSAAAASQAQPEKAERARRTALVLAPELAGVDPSVATGWARTKDSWPLPRGEGDIDSFDDTAVALSELFDAEWLRKRGRLAEAVQLLQRSLYERPAATDVRRELVALYREMGELDHAVRELSMLLWAEPTTERHLELANLYLELDEPLKALEHVQEALALDPDDREALRLREALSPPAI